MYDIIYIKCNQEKLKILVTAVFDGWLSKALDFQFHMC